MKKTNFKKLIVVMLVISLFPLAVSAAESLYQTGNFSTQMGFTTRTYIYYENNTTSSVKINSQSQWIDNPISNNEDVDHIYQYLRDGNTVKVAEKSWVLWDVGGDPVKPGESANFVGYYYQTVNKYGTQAEAYSGATDIGSVVEYFAGWRVLFTPSSISKYTQE